MATAGYYQLEVVNPCASYPTTIYIIRVIDPSLVLWLSLQGFGRDGEYLQWLAADLAKANQTRKERPWLFVAGHRPLYTGEVARNAYMHMVVFECMQDLPMNARKFQPFHPHMTPTGQTTDDTMRSTVEDLFKKYAVDVYFSGHEHRSKLYWLLVMEFIFLDTCLSRLTILRKLFYMA
jgi:hypothetical protein